MAARKTLGTKLDSHNAALLDAIAAQQGVTRYEALQKAALAYIQEHINSIEKATEAA